jgi:hypothetical protein
VVAMFVNGSRQNVERLRTKANCFCLEQTLEKTEGAIQRHRQDWVHKRQDEDKKKQKTTQKTKKMSNMDPTKNRG